MTSESVRPATALVSNPLPTPLMVKTPSAVVELLPIERSNDGVVPPTKTMAPTFVWEAVAVLKLILIAVAEPFVPNNAISPATGVPLLLVQLPTVNQVVLEPNPDPAPLPLQPKVAARATCWVPMAARKQAAAKMSFRLFFIGRLGSGYGSEITTVQQFRTITNFDKNLPSYRVSGGGSQQCDPVEDEGKSRSGDDEQAQARRSGSSGVKAASAKSLRWF